MTTNLKNKTELALFEDCINFWNKEGKRIYQDNLDKKLGNADTQKLAKECSFDLWLLFKIADDCKTCFKSPYESGRSGSHVWIHNEHGKRVFMIYVANDQLVVRDES